MRWLRIAVTVLLLSLSTACVATFPAPSDGPSAASPSASPEASTPGPTRSAAAIDPSATPQGESPGPTTESTPEASQAEPSLPPPPGAPRLAGVVSVWQGGCGALYRGTELVGLDDCGPFGFDGLLRSDAIRVRAGSRLVLRAPDGSAFSVRTAHLPGEWTIKLARAAQLEGHEDTQSFPSGIGTILAHGRGPDSAIVITMPTDPGLYVVQVEGPLARDGWTFVEGVWFWLVRVV